MLGHPQGSDWTVLCELQLNVHMSGGNDHFYNKTENRGQILQPQPNRNLYDNELKVFPKFQKMWIIL